MRNITVHHLIATALIYASFLCSPCTSAEADVQNRKVDQVYLDPQLERGIDIEKPDDRMYIRSVSPVERRRKLSWWSAIMNFVLCPPGHHHDDNPHCHHSSHPSSSSHNDGDGGTDDGDGDTDDANGGNDDANGGNDDANGGNDDGDDNNGGTQDDELDNISNDNGCWWCTGDESQESTPFAYSTNAKRMYAGVGVAGVAVVVSLFLRRRNTAVVGTVDKDGHLLSGAVGKRKKTFVERIHTPSPKKASTAGNKSHLLSGPSLFNGPPEKRKKSLAELFRSKFKGRKHASDDTELPVTNYVKA